MVIFCIYKNNIVLKNNILTGLQKVPIYSSTAIKHKLFELNIQNVSIILDGMSQYIT